MGLLAGLNLVVLEAKEEEDEIKSEEKRKPRCKIDLNNEKNENYEK